MFVSQKVPFLEISDDFIACDLWFGPPPQLKILATPMPFDLAFSPRSIDANFVIEYSPLCFLLKLAAAATPFGISFLLL